MTASNSGLGRIFISLSDPRFRMLSIGMLFSLSAMQMNQVVQPWLAFNLTGSGLAIGILTSVHGLPMILLAPFGGVFADRFNKRKLLIITQTSLGFLALISAILVYLDVIQLWHLVVIGFLQGAITPFNMPTRQAYIPELVKKEYIPNAYAVDGMAMNISRILAPSLAGILMAWHPTYAFFTVAVMHCGAVFTLFHLPTGKAALAKSKGTLIEIMAGVRYIRSRPTLLTLFGMSTLIGALGLSYPALLPIFQANVLHVGEASLGFMYAAIGAGALIGSLTMAFLSGSSRRGQILIFSSVCLGFFLALFAFSTLYPMSMSLLILMGISGQVSLVTTRIFLIMNIDRTYYGRVMSVYLMSLALQPVAVLPLSALVDHIGVQTTVSATGVLLAIAIIVIAIARPAIWRNLSETKKPG